MLSEASRTAIDQSTSSDFRKTEKLGHENQTANASLLAEAPIGKF